MQYQTLIVEIKDKVAKIMLNRPEKKNAMSPQLHEDMTQRSRSCATTTRRACW